MKKKATPAAPEISQLTPVLMVPNVEKTAAFYTTCLGFERGAEVTTDGETTFLILENGAVELMLQATSSLHAELPDAFPKRPQASALLYMDVDDIRSLYASLEEKAEIVKPLHRAPHGEWVFYARDPNGYILGFAE